MRHFPAGVVIWSVGAAMVGSACLGPPQPTRSTDDGWTTLPAEFAADYFFLSLRINDQGPYRFMIDSGAFPTVVDVEVARSLSLPQSAPPQGVPSAGELELVDAVLSGDGIVFEPEAIVVHKLSGPPSEFFGRRLHGVLGADFFADQILELDYVAGTVRVRPSEDFVAQPADHVVPLMVRGRPLTLVTLGAPGQESVGVLALVDTGDSGCLHLARSLAEGFGLPGAVPTVVTGERSLAGDSTSVAFRLESATLGDVRVDQPILTVSPDEPASLTGGTQARIGTDVLSKFTVTFDLPRRRMLLRPNAREAEPIDVSSTGLGLGARGESFERVEVVNIGAGSPAEESGFELGDILRSVDGRAVAEFEFQELREQIQRAVGRTLAVEVVRDGVQVSLSLTPRRRLEMRE